MIAHITLNKKTFRLKNRSKRRGQNWDNRTHKRKEIKFSDHHFLIYANVICRFCIFLMCTRHIRKMQKLQIWYGYIKKWWSENFISFLLCVRLSQFCPRRLDLFFNRKVFLFNLPCFFYNILQVVNYNLVILPQSCIIVFVK